MTPLPAVVGRIVEIEEPLRIGERAASLSSFTLTWQGRHSAPTGLLALEDVAYMNTALSRCIHDTSAVAHQSAKFGRYEGLNKHGKASLGSDTAGVARIFFP